MIGNIVASILPPTTPSALSVNVLVVAGGGGGGFDLSGGGVLVV
jgi:hypothetical protein